MGPDPRYEILDTIASGDFATVCRARDRDLNLRCLGPVNDVKILRTQLMATAFCLGRDWRIPLA